METTQNLFEMTRQCLTIPLVKLGGSPVTLWTVLQLVLLVLLLFYLSGKLRTVLVNKVLIRMEPGARQATGTIVRYTIITIGFIVILQTSGIDLTALNVLAGAIGVGVGFGLQNIINNFISGLIILFERPIKVGDRIVVGDVEGDVIHIGGRSTTVVTNDNISIIVPNSKFITEDVINWSHNDRKVRFKIPVSVAYGTDIDLVERLLLEVADGIEDVLKDPAPGTRLMEFGESGLGFELRVWSTTLMQRKGVLISRLNIAIYKSFSEHGIEIPYPRRDLTIRGSIPLPKK